MGQQWCPGYFFGSWIAIFDTSNCWFLFLCHKPLLMSMPPPNHTEWERRFTQIFLSPPFWAFEKISKARFYVLGFRENLEGSILQFWAFEKISKARFCSFGLSKKSRRLDFDVLGFRENLEMELTTNDDSNTVRTSFLSVPK